MRVILILLIGIHGIIHLFGFLKAFGISEFNAITQPISKPFGLLWLLAFLLFFITNIQIVRSSNYWWVGACLALIVSQFLIVSYWSDAKFGTIVNVIILFVSLIAYSTYSFNNKVSRERTSIFEKSETLVQKNVTKEAVSEQPPIVQKWLINSGVVGKPFVSNVYLVQELQLKMKPEQTDWNSGVAEQYFTIAPPAFNWNINTQMNSFMRVVGRDKFEDGKGEMIIKLLSLIPVADAKNNEKVNQATLQRFLAEIVWFPSAALSPHIKWDSLGNYAAKATMEYKGTKGSGEFYFDENGNFKKFVALRYQDSKAKEPTEWTVVATKSEERNGIKIPVACEVSWTLDDSKWMWLKLKIQHIQYNVEKMPVTK